MESLTQEQDKLVMMGTIKPSKDQALVVGYSKMDSKGKKNANPKKPLDQKKDKSKSHEESSNFKKRYVLIFQDLSQDIDVFLHARALGMKYLTTICALVHFTFTFLLLGILLGT